MKPDHRWERLEDSLLPAEALPESLEAQLVQPPRIGLWLFWGIGGLLLAIVVWALLSELEVTVRCQGYIRPVLPTQVVRSPMDGLVEAVAVRLHQRVRRGDTLLRFRNTELQLRLRVVEEELRNEEQLFAELSTLLRSLPSSGTPPQLAAAFPAMHWNTPQARSLAELIRKDLLLLARHYDILAKRLERLAALHAKQFASAEEYESSAAEVRLQELRALQYIQSRRQELAQKLDATEHRLRELQQLLGTLREQLSKTALIAHTDGQISSLLVPQAGVYVTAGQELLAITPDLQLETELLVAPQDIPLVRPGQRVRYLVTGFPLGQWEALWGRVESIAEELTTLDGRPAYRVRASLEQSALRMHRLADRPASAVPLHKGLPVQAAIYVGRKPVLAWLYDRSRFLWHELSP